MFPRYGSSGTVRGAVGLMQVKGQFRWLREGTLKAEDIRCKPSKVGHAFPGRGNILKQERRQTLKTSYKIQMTFKGRSWNLVAVGWRLISLGLGVCVDGAATQRARRAQIPA